MRPSRLVITILATMFAVTACGNPSSTSSDEFDAIPASAWPDLTGVSVMSSRGYKGQECCETHQGGRIVELAVAAAADLHDAKAVVVRALRAEGWTTFACVPKFRPCLQQGDYFVEFLRPRKSDGTGGVDLFVLMKRFHQA